MLPYLNPVAYWHFVKTNLSNWGYGNTPQYLWACTRRTHSFTDWSHNDTRTIRTELIHKVDVEYNVHGHLTLVKCVCAVCPLLFLLRSESGRL